MKSVYKSPEGKQEIIGRYEEILKYWPVANEKIIVPTSYGETFIIACGAEGGTPVILLHGSSTNSAMWMGDAETLGKTCRVYAVDIIGEPGKSAESRPDSKNGDNYAEWLKEVLDGLNISKAAFVGNSLGGWMSIAFASHYPERVESLVLLASGGISEMRPSFMLKVLVHASRGNMDKINKLIYGDLEMPEEVLSFGRLIGKSFIPRTKGYGAYPDKILKSLSMPVLYIAGDGDVLLPTVKNARRLKAHVPHADIRVLPGLPHALIGFAGEIAEFIDRKRDAT
jgi:pimeloyl-ACP methyl ester carboxylesterase